MPAFRFFRTYVALYADAVVLPLQTYLPTRLGQPWARLRTYLPTSEFLRRGNTSAHSKRSTYRVATLVPHTAVICQRPTNLGT